MLIQSLEQKTRLALATVILTVIGCTAISIFAIAKSFSIVQEERNQMFGVAPATVWENIKGYKNNHDLVNTLAQGEAFAHDLMDSFIASILKRWKLVLAHRIIPDNMDTVRQMVSIHTDSRNSIDDKRFAEVNDLRFYLAKDSDDRKSLFTRIVDALREEDYDTASALQIEMNDKMEELEAKYANYSKNIF